jgi:hypothetical protein
MPKLKNNSLKINTPAVARKNPKGLIVLLVVIILGTLIVVGQQGDPMAKKDIPVADRFENAIKVKEPQFKLAGKHVSKNQQENSVLQGWKSGEDFVSVTTYEFTSAAEAAELLRKTLNAPVSVPVQIVTLTQLGDEAYLQPGGPHTKDGHTQLFFRKGNFVLIMSASKPGLVQRFAKHMADEISN